MKYMLVGITGQIAAGKGEVAQRLRDRGFYHVSFSGLIEEEIRARGSEVSRDTLYQVRNDLRREHGPDVLALRCLEKLAKVEHAVVESVRTPGELAVLRTHQNFVLLAVDAPIELRFLRARARGRVGDGVTLEEFRAQEERENVVSPFGQNIGAVVAHADYTIVNDKSLDYLTGEVEAFLSRYK